MSFWRRRDWLRRFFEDLEREFEMFDEMFESMFRSIERETKERRPIFYGFSMTIGPDGKPIIREFGNVKPVGRKIVTTDVREPFVDVIYDEQNNEVKIIAEMPGVTKDKINVEASEDSVYIKAENHDRKYETTVPLDIKVDPNSAKASYKNGVLEIRLKTKEPVKKSGVRINVE